MLDNTKTTKHCIICGKPIDVTGLVSSMQERLISVGVCYGCDTWMGEWQDRHNEAAVRAGGHHYRIGESSAREKGMGGAQLIIKFYDGRTIITDNLWHQGKIPAPFKTSLPDNAFIERN